MASFTISTRMEVDERGFQTVERGLGRIENRARNVRAELSGFRILGLAIIGRQIQSLADEFSTLQNRIRFVTNSEAELAVVTEKLLALSNDTRSSFANNTQLFTRLAVSSRELGFSFEELLQFSSRLNKTIALSGATTKEAGGALIQLSQGLASGTLRGDELRSVLEQLPAVADVIAREFDTTRGALRSLGQQGVLESRRVVKAFIDQGAAIDKAFAKSIPTLRQSFEVLRNQIVAYVGAVDNAGGVTAKLSQAVLLLGKNIDLVARIIITLFVAKAIGQMLNGLARLRVALLTNPLFVLGSLLVGAVGALVAFADKIVVLSDGVTTLQDVAVVTFETLIRFLKEADYSTAILTAKISGAVIAFTALIGPLVRIGAIVARNPFLLMVAGITAAGIAITLLIGKIKELVSDISTAEKQATNAKELADVGEQILRRIKQQKQLQALLEKSPGNTAALGELRQIEARLATLRAQQKALLGQADQIDAGDTSRKFADDTASGIIQGLRDSGLGALIPGLFKDVGLNAAQAVGDGVQQSGLIGLIDTIFGTAADRAAQRTAENLKKQQDIAKAQAFLQQGFDPADSPEFIAKIEKLREENELIAQQIGLNKQQQDALEALSKVNVAMTQSQRERFTAQAQLNAQLKEELRLYNDIQGPIQKYIQEKQALDVLLVLGKINQDQYNQKLLDLEIAANRASGTIGGELKARIGELAKEVGSAAKIIGDIFTSAINNTADALTEFVVNGKADIKQFAQSFITDIVRILVKLLILQALQAVTGTAPAGAAAGAAVNVAARAEGGPVEANKAFLVGEEGPELFVPKSMGQIIPADRTAAVMSQSAQAPQEPAAPPVVNVAVQNVIDPSMSLDAMATPQGHKVIVNAIRSNKGAIKRDLA